MEQPAHIQNPQPIMPRHMQESETSWIIDQILMNLPDWNRTPCAFSCAGYILSEPPEQIAPACLHLSTMPTMVQMETPHWVSPQVHEAPMPLSLDEQQIVKKPQKMFTRAIHWKMKPHMNQVRKF